jgi:hypothetical protein
MDESDGASLPKRGRPSVYGGKTTRIRLATDVFHQWNIRKDEMGYSNKTHSEFAEILLQKSMEIAVATTETSSPERPVSPTGTIHLHIFFYKELGLTNYLHMFALVDI